MMENIEQIDITKKIQDFSDIMQQFSLLLDEENTALKAFDVKTISKLSAPKQQMVNSYRNMTAFLIKHHTELENIDTNIKLLLKERFLSLDTKLKENDLLLKTRMETSKTVLDSIIRIAKVTNNANATSYGARGMYSPLDNNRNALAINQTL